MKTKTGRTEEKRTEAEEAAFLSFFFALLFCPRLPVFADSSI